MKKKVSPILGVIGTAFLVSAVAGSIENAHASNSWSDLNNVKNDVWKVTNTQPTTQTFITCHSNCHNSCHGSCGRKGW